MLFDIVADLQLIYSVYGAHKLWMFLVIQVSNMMRLNSPVRHTWNSEACVEVPRRLSFESAP